MRKLVTILATVAMMAVVAMPSATAAVERYQFTDVVLDITHVNNTAAFAHQYAFRHNPCTDTWVVLTATQGSMAEFISDISVDGDTVSYTSLYDRSDDYTYTATIQVGETGDLALVSGTGGVGSVTGTGSITQSDYNHGEYVAASIDEYGPDAHSCIGMPVASRR